MILKIMALLCSKLLIFFLFYFEILYFISKIGVNIKCPAKLQQIKVIPHTLDNNLNFQNVHPIGALQHRS